MEICKGSLVYSRAGRDKGELFLVLKVENGYVYLTDGDLRRVSKPKKKKILHINKTNKVLEVNDNMTDSDVKKALQEFVK